MIVETPKWLKDNIFFKQHYIGKYDNFVERGSFYIIDPIFFYYENFMACYSQRHDFSKIGSRYKYMI
jgi:hypothetical protein